MEQETGTVIEDVHKSTPRAGHRLGEMEAHDARFALISLRDVLIGISLATASLAMVVWWLFQPTQSSRVSKKFQNSDAIITPIAAVRHKEKPVREISDSEIAAMNTPEESPAEPADEEATESTPDDPAVPASADRRAPLKLKIRPAPMPLDEPIGLPTKTQQAEIPIGATATNAASDEPPSAEETVITSKSIGPSVAPLGTNDPTPTSDTPAKAPSDTPVP